MSDRSDPEPFDPDTIISTLNRHDVSYVVIGAFAAQLQGVPIRRTRDIDVTPSTEEENLQRLSDALHELHARIRTSDSPEGLPFDHDGASLGRVRVWNLTTSFGEFDICFAPSGTRGYEDLVLRARVVNNGGEEIPVAALEDVIRSKEAAGRPKDILQLPILIQAAQRRRLHPGSR